jgi:X-X-X-Leu-X-X-Gly heptad repeat protein
MRCGKGRTMRHMKFGIGTKIFAGFILLIGIGLMTGGSGYFSLNRVISDGSLDETANQVKIKILQARRFEKNFVIRGDDESYKSLVQALTELEQATSRLKELMGESKEADEINAARAVYVTAAEELKKAREEDAEILKGLQDIAAQITSEAEKGSSAVVSKTKGAVLDTVSKKLREDALKRVSEVVSVGFDFLKYYQEKMMPREAAYEAIRNIHFEGSNYFFIVDEDLTLLAHGSNRSLEGMDLGKLQDQKTGKVFMNEVVENAIKNGESSTEYYWNKPGIEGQVFPKLTYAKYFKPWGVILCAGVYVDDIEQAAAKTGAIVEDGLGKVQQAEAINILTMQARLNAAYHFAFEKDGEKVAESIGQLKKAEIATEDLKKAADNYLATFNRRLANTDRRNKVEDRIVAVARKIIETADSIGEGALASFAGSASNGKKMITGFILIGALAGLIFAALLVRAIVKPINRAVSGLEDAADQIATGAGEISSGSQQLAEGTSEQAASLEETSSALEQMASMTRQNADHAAQANALASSATKEIDEAGRTMSQLTSSIDEISKAGEETQKIIQTIDGIAFQTNLLALNAAVEAARAGEAGAGFAVVADEVRSLAMKAAQAAKDTAAMIDDSAKKIRGGAELVTKTNSAFARISENALKIGELVSEIAVASSEQAQGIDQVSRAVSEMDKVVQHNAANAEESASASEQMNAQAEHMKVYVTDLAGMVTGKGGNNHSGLEEMGGARLALAEMKQEGKGGRCIAPAPAKGKDMVPAENKPARTRPSRPAPVDESSFDDF